MRDEIVAGREGVDDNEPIDVQAPLEQVCIYAFLYTKLLIYLSTDN